MKRLALLLLAIGISLAASAKNIKTVVLTTNPPIHCENCCTTIKNNIRFEKGVKEIVTDLEKKTVTIKYDADKTSVEALLVAFDKINRKATVVGDGSEK